MKNFVKENIQIILSSAVLFVATLFFVFQKNYEFLVYTFTLAFLIYLVYVLDKKYGFMKSAKWGFFMWMVMHMAGGSLFIYGTRLYDVILIPFFGEPYNILKYDQLVHFFCYVVMTLLMYPILKTIVKKNFNKIIFLVVLVLAASSIGAINEIIEFSTVVMFESNGVGGYFNTLIDLIANLLGAVAAAIYIANSKSFSKR